MTVETEELGRKGRALEDASWKSMLGVRLGEVEELSWVLLVVRERASESMCSDRSVPRARAYWGARARVERPWPQPRSRRRSRGPSWLWEG